MGEGQCRSGQTRIAHPFLHPGPHGIGVTLCESRQQSIFAGHRRLGYPLERRLGIRGRGSDRPSEG
ncbi:hypothetical protein, partial [Streptomyces sp. BRA346]|uniref:hypothetical protein n=1 Tax=Streptomyces sp. BRA346 TaxID=2878199 RepID=UPI004062F504